MNHEARCLDSRTGKFSLILSLFMLVMVAGCDRTPPEKALRNTITTMIEASEAHKIGTLMKHVDADFDGQNGEYDRKQLYSFLRFLILRNAVIHVLVTDTRIELRKTQYATATLKVLLTGGAGLIPERGRQMTIVTGWRNDGDWKLVNATWDG